MVWPPLVWMWISHMTGWSGTVRGERCPESPSGHMSLGLVSQHGLGFLVGSQTCYRISQKAEGELGRASPSGTWFNPSDLTDENIWDEGRRRFSVSGGIRC